MPILTLGFLVGTLVTKTVKALFKTYEEVRHDNGDEETASGPLDFSDQRDTPEYLNHTTPEQGSHSSLAAFADTYAGLEELTNGHKELADTSDQKDPPAYQNCTTPEQDSPSGIANITGTTTGEDKLTNGHEETIEGPDQNDPPAEGPADTSVQQEPPNEQSSTTPREGNPSRIHSNEGTAVKEDETDDMADIFVDPTVMYCKFSNTFNNSFMNAMMQSILNLCATEMKAKNELRELCEALSATPAFRRFFLTALFKPGRRFSPEEILPVIKEISTKIPSQFLKKQSNASYLLGYAMLWVNVCGIQSTMVVNKVTQCDNCQFREETMADLGPFCVLPPPT